MIVIAVVDESAFMDALDNGTIAGVGLDVFWREADVQDCIYQPEKTLC